MDLRSATITDLSTALAGGQVSAVDLVTQALNLAQQENDTFGAYLSFRQSALEDARASDEYRRRHDPRPLEGIPIAIKDNLTLADEITTAGSAMLANYRAVYTATSVARLQRAGAIVIGKTNLDEFAMGGSTENSAVRPARNPWDLNRVPGGSSGGSAVTVAAGHVPAALGSDTGGSVRQPASFCGVVGMKPTYGRVSRSGLVALASSLDQVGPLTRSVADAAIVYSIIAGHDPLDATTSTRSVEAVEAMLAGDLTKIRIGLPTEFFGPGVDPDVSTIVRQAAATYERLGATIEDVSIPHAGLGLATYYIILPAEASANLARYDGIRYGRSATDVSSLIDRYAASRERGLGPEVKRRIMVGTYVLSAGYADAYYRRALHIQQVIREEFHQVFDQVDVLLTPTAPTPPFPLGARTADPLQMYMTDLLTVPANLAGLPAMSVPGGISHGLPVGIQLITNRWQEATLFRVAQAYEQATDWHTHRPPTADIVNRQKN